MKFDTCTIYKRKKMIAILPCKYVKKTDLHEEYFLITNHGNIKPGYILVINEQEKFYVTDVRLPHPQDTHIEVYFETIAQHREKIFSFWIPVVISIIALLRPEITKLISYISNLIAKLG